MDASPVECSGVSPRTPSLDPVAPAVVLVGQVGRQFIGGAVGGVGIERAVRCVESHDGSVVASARDTPFGTDDVRMVTAEDGWV